MPAYRRIDRTRRDADPVPLAVYMIVSGNSLLCVLFIGLREYHTGMDTFRFLLWNLFLAWLPMIASLAAIQAFRMLRETFRVVALVLLGIGWLLFFPNAPYLTTDFIHLIFQRYDPDSMLLWYDLVVFFLFSWCAGDPAEQLGRLVQSVSADRERAGRIDFGRVLVHALVRHADSDSVRIDVRIGKRPAIATCPRRIHG